MEWLADLRVCEAKNQRCGCLWMHRKRPHGLQAWRSITAAGHDIGRIEPKLQLCAIKVTVFVAVDAEAASAHGWHNGKGEFFARCGQLLQILRGDFFAISVGLKKG